MFPAELLFWLAFGLIFWTYLGYAVMLQVLALFRSRPVIKADIEPAVSMVITAYNEERRIREKIENSLSVDYPRERLEIIVVSDGSTDRTDSIVEEFAAQGVKLIRVQERRGKHHGQRHGIVAARHEIIVFSDATTFLRSDAIRKIVRSFADPSVGVVSGEDSVNDDVTSASGEGAYVRYEMWVRHLETRVGSLVGASGCFFAVRRKLAIENWIDDVSSDFYMPVAAAVSGFRTVSDEEAIGYYTVLHDPAKEFQRKVRTVLHGLEVLFAYSAVLNPMRYGFFSVQIISHKLMRWLVPLALLILFVTNAGLVEVGNFYRLTMIAQIVFYAGAAVAALKRSLQSKVYFKIPLFFVMVNLSIVVAWYQYLTGRKQVVWEATRR